MLKDRKPNQYWVEPFVGGGNIIDKVDGNRIGADINYYIIKALIGIRDFLNDLPKVKSDLSEEKYKHIQKYKEQYKDHLVGYIGYACSYAGKFFGGYCRDKLNKRDYVKEAYNNAVKQSPKLKDIYFLNCSYEELEIPENSIIYCDPPYRGTTGYKKTNNYNYKFNHDIFWQWCREKTINGHKVFISEYNAPEDFKCICSKELNSSLTQDTGSKKAVEKLFVHK